MNTVIVPVDFSATSLHTARYAAQLLAGRHGVHMLLYHSFSKKSDEANVTASLEELKKELAEKYYLKIDIIAKNDDNFVEGLVQAVRHRKADIVIMGITGKTGLAKLLFGSNTLKMVKTKVCPVLIVPDKAPFTEIKNVMLPSDFKDTFHTTPSAPIKDFLGVFNPKLHIINVDMEHYISLTEKHEKEKQHLVKMFESYHPEFYFMRLNDIDEAITLFAKDKHIDLIILIRKNESFMEKLFKGSHTKTFSYHSKVPILVMHE